MSLDSVRVIRLADKCVQTALGPDKDVTLVLVLTHCENICLLNYANAADVVSTFYLTRGAGHGSDRRQIIRVTRCLRLLLISVSSVCVCVAIQKQRAAVSVWTPSGWRLPHQEGHICKHSRPIGMVKKRNLHWKYKSTAENWEGQRVEDGDLLVRSTGTGLPQRKERGQSSECGQVTESPRSPRHLDTQGHRHRKMCYIRRLISIGGCDLLSHCIPAHKLNTNTLSMCFIHLAQTTMSHKYTPH